MSTDFRGKQEDAIFVLFSQKDPIDSKRLYQHPPEATRLQVRDNGSKRTVKILFQDAFQKGRN